MVIAFMYPSCLKTHVKFWCISSSRKGLYYLFLIGSWIYHIVRLETLTILKTRMLMQITILIRWLCRFKEKCNSYQIQISFMHWILFIVIYIKGNYLAYFFSSYVMNNYHVWWHIWLNLSPDGVYHESWLV